MLPTLFKVNKPFGSGEELKNRFSRWPPWQPSWISNQNNFSHFRSISHPDASYQVSSQLAFGFRRRSEKKIFKMAITVAIFDFRSARFYLFLIYKSPCCFLPSLESIGLSTQEMKWKIDFHDGGHLGFPIGTILAIFDLQITLMLPTKFRVNWHLGLGEEAKNRFSRWPPWRPFWIYNWHDFSYFWSTCHPNASY